MADKISSIKLPDGTTYDIKAKAVDDGAISITTTGTGNAITALSESSGTITATKGAFVTSVTQDSSDSHTINIVTNGASSSITIPDTNTTYTLAQDASDGHKLTFTPSLGKATAITIPSNTYASGDSFTINGNQVICTGMTYSTSSFRGWMALPQYVDASSVTLSTTPTYVLKVNGKTVTPSAVTYSITDGRVQVAATLSSASAHYAAVLYATGSTTFTFS